MAWRIQDSITRGEIDNRQKGLVRGLLWLHGAEHPVELELIGNACPDLAGCLLKFRNPQKTIPLGASPGLHPRQRGCIGDLTASRKVRLPPPPLPGDDSPYPPPDGQEQTANSLYLEWFSDLNGRVLIEAVGWEVEISPPEWRLSPEEEEQRARDAATGMERFLQKLTAEIEKHKIEDHERQWDEHDYEKFFRECDARGEKFGELLEKYGDLPGGDEKISEAMGWSGDLDEPDEEEDDDAEPFSAEDLVEDVPELEELPDPEPDPARAGIDWIRTEDGHLRHPLQHRCRETGFRYWKALEQLPGLLQEHEAVQQFIFELQAAGAKLTGALQPIAENRCFAEPAFTVAYLKRALNHIHLSQAGLESAATQKILPPPLTTEARAELFALRQAIIDLMEYYRSLE